MFACSESTEDPLAPEEPQATFNPTPLDPADAALALQRIDQLKAQIDAFRDAGDVSATTETKLDERLNGAALDIRRGKKLFAIARMVEFIAFVKFQPEKNITTNAAAVLVQRAHEIINILHGKASNQKPGAEIETPTDQSIVVAGAPIDFPGAASDAEDGALTGAALVWTSSIGGQIGTGVSFTVSNLTVAEFRHLGARDVVGQARAAASLHGFNDQGKSGSRRLHQPVGLSSCGSSGS